MELEAGNTYVENALSQYTWFYFRSRQDIKILPINSDPTLGDSDGDHLLDNEDPKPLITYFIEEKYFSDIDTSFKKIGSVMDHSFLPNQSVKRDIWIIKSDYNQDRANKINIFENNDVFKNSILIIDLTMENDISYQVYNSYQYKEINIMNEVIKCIKNCNDGLPDRSRYQRTNIGMYCEWVIHNEAYDVLSDRLLEFLPYIGDDFDIIINSAKHVDLDEHADGTPMEWLDLIREELS